MANIKLVDVCKKFGAKETLSNIALEIHDGEMLALLGPSGSGKTTLLKIVAGLEQPTSGRVFFNEVDYTDAPAQKRKAIIVFQDYGLFPHMTVGQNVAFGLRARGEERQQILTKVKNILQLVQLSGRESSLPAELSGGEKQRVALARACVVEPGVLLLDEPFSNLDTSLRLGMREFVAALQKKLKFTCVLVTHDKEEAFMMSERVAVILDNRLEQVAPPEIIYRKPATKKVADFMGDANYVPGKVISGKFVCELGVMPVNEPDTDAALGMFQGDQISLGRAGTGFSGTVTARKFAGKLTYYTVAMGPHLSFKVTSVTSDFLVGETVSVAVAPSGVNVYPLAEESP
ncbi:MAG: hypothetical protein FD169_1601 [Bacillota bacterium]|nr:MAG: hypothetical protein FD169_1601 [Bacillota bacterium]MBS3950272.1 ABC transporter ATP-binding protein [Peptococcaceae bacterium]